MTEVLADKFEGKRLNSPNDVVVKSDGSIWFTDPPGGMFNVGMVGHDLQRPAHLASRNGVGRHGEADLHEPAVDGAGGWCHDQPPGLRRDLPVDAA